MKEIIVTTNEEGTTLVKLLGKHLKEAPSSFLYKMLRKKNITLNTKKATGKEPLHAGDCIRIFLSDETYDKFSGGVSIVEQSNSEYSILKNFAQAKKYEQLPVIYEDKDILVVNKPAGLLSQKTTPSDVSANELFLAYLIATNQLSQSQFLTLHPSVCNRLDRNTSGLLLCGKTIHGMQMLSDLLRERTMEKYYICLVKGVVSQNVQIEGYLLKDEKKNTVSITDTPVSGAKYIKTAYEPISNNGKYTRLKVHLITGRSHQIRAHLSYIGHPILGDPKYGDIHLNRHLEKEYGLHYQMLHSYEMLFENGLHLFAPVPEIFDKIEEEK